MINQLPKVRFSLPPISGALYFFSICFFAVASYNFYFSTRILPGVYVNDQYFGGLTKKEAHEKLKNLYFNHPDTIKLYFSSTADGEKSVYEISLSDLDFKYDLTSTYTKVFSTGRQNFLSPLTYAIGFFKPVENISLDYHYEESKLNSLLANFSAQKYPQVSNASFILNDQEELIIQEAQPGLLLDLLSVKKDIEKGFLTYKFEHQLVTSEYVPTIFGSDLEPFTQGVEYYLQSPLFFTYKNIEVSANSSEKLSLLDFSKNPQGTLLITPNKYGILSFINIVGSKVDVEAKSTQFELKENGDIVFSPPVLGLSINRSTLENDLSQYIKSYDFNALKDVNNSIALDISETRPEQNANDYGIKELIAEGVSYFSHSSSNRISNIATASQKVKGTLVAPGENFSFNDAVGPIDVEHGFNTGYIISKGRTVLGTGGGVCQVSTTVFRAALYAGLPSVKRTAHAYRVSYYEEKSPIGLDATIYQPSVDFVFKNDMENYILVYTVLDIQAKKLEVKIYGTKDGRTVDLSEPKILSQVPPPAPVYVDDPSLPKGTIIQEEWPSYGASASFTRKVTKDNKVLYDDEFKSYYVPWAALYRRGI